MTLDDFFASCPRTAVALSGGVDSVYLLHEASRLAKSAAAYFVRSQFQPEFELDDARRAAAGAGTAIKVIEVDVLSDERVASNPKDRCYWCKRRIFERIIEEARRDGYESVIDGTNASDDLSDRPGARALAELGVRSPLRECGLTKDAIRRESHALGLFTWDKPSYACLATRIPHGTKISSDVLARVEGAEMSLAAMGLRDFRVRVLDGAARIQIKRDEMEMAFAMRDDIRRALGEHFDVVLLDLAPR